MERIKSIEQLKLQKELLQLQQMITELRMKQDIHLIKRKMNVRGLVLPSIKQLLKTGVKTGVGKQLLFSTAKGIAKRLFRKKSR
jgi:hypothetical protein